MAVPVSSNSIIRVALLPMEDNDWTKGSWFDFLYRLFKEADPRYVANDGKQKLRDALLFGAASFILIGFFTALVAFVVKYIGI